MPTFRVRKLNCTVSPLTLDLLLLPNNSVSDAHSARIRIYFRRSEYFVGSERLCCSDSLNNFALYDHLEAGQENAWSRDLLRSPKIQKSEHSRQQKWNTACFPLTVWVMCFRTIQSTSKKDTNQIDSQIMQRGTIYLQSLHSHDGDLPILAISHTSCHRKWVELDEPPSSKRYTSFVCLSPCGSTGSNPW